MTEQPPIDHEAFKQFERTGYSRVAEGYDHATAPVTAQVNDAVLDAVEAGRETRLLDVACGPGWLSAAAAQRGAIVTGVAHRWRSAVESLVDLRRSRGKQAHCRVK